MADDHAYQAISAYGSAVSKLAPTPNIDRIANQEQEWMQYFTNSICGPSRSILTGKLSHINGFYKNVDGGDFNGEQLHFQRYFSKWLPDRSYWKMALGDYSNWIWLFKSFDQLGWQGTYLNLNFVSMVKTLLLKIKGILLKLLKTIALIGWVLNTTKPFMLLYQFKAPQGLEPDSIYHELFTDFDFPEPESFNDKYEGRLAASENMMEIENHLNRRDLKQVPPPGLSRRDSMMASLRNKVNNGLPTTLLRGT